MSYYQPVQQASYDPEIIYIVNSPLFKDWYQYHSQFFPFENEYEAAVVFFLEGLPDVVSHLTSDLHSCMSSPFPIRYPSLSHYRAGIKLLSMIYQSITGPSHAAASCPQPNTPTRNYPHYDGSVPIVRSQGTPQERWDPLKSQLFNTTGIEEGKNYAGQSILTDWLDQLPGQRSWTCQVPVEGSGGRPCGAGFSRVDRAIVHIRGKHLDMRPYLCGNGGNCQVPNWLAPFFYPVTWDKRSFTDCTCFFPVLWLSPPERTGQNIGTQRRFHATNGMSLLHSLPWMSYLWTQ